MRTIEPEELLAVSPEGGCATSLTVGSVTAAIPVTPVIVAFAVTTALVNEAFVKSVDFFNASVALVLGTVDENSIATPARRFVEVVAVDTDVANVQSASMV